MTLQHVGEIGVRGVVRRLGKYINNLVSRGLRGSNKSGKKQELGARSKKKGAVLQEIFGNTKKKKEEMNVEER